MMSVLTKRNVLVGIATLLVGIGASAAIWGMPKFLKRSTAIKGQVTVYLLDERGAVNGLLLASGDQAHFSPQTGAAVTAQIKVGDEVTVVGHVGSQTSYGREVRAEQISANGRTIVETEMGPPHGHGPHGKPGPKDREDRPGPPDARAANDQAEPKVSPGDPARTAVIDPNAKQADNASPAAAPEPTPEIFKATGTIRAHLVNGHGDVDGLILSTGEQIRFSPKVGKLIIAAEQGTSTVVTVEGNGVRNDIGIVIRPTQVTVGSQTITLGR